MLPYLSSKPHQLLARPWQGDVFSTVLACHLIPSNGNFPRNERDGGSSEYGEKEAPRRGALPRKVRMSCPACPPTDDAASQSTDDECDANEGLITTKVKRKATACSAGSKRLFSPSGACPAKTALPLMLHHFVSRNSGCKNRFALLPDLLWRAQSGLVADRRVDWLPRMRPFNTKCR